MKRSQYFGPSNLSFFVLLQKEQRDYLLSVALEFEMVQYLRNCVRDWCDGSHAVAGCTLPALLQWAWGRVERYKKWLDRMRKSTNN